MTKRFFCQNIDNTDNECVHCCQIAKYVETKYRPECRACHNDPELHAPICCNANFLERLPEFVACAMHRPRDEYGKRLVVVTVQWGDNELAKNRLNNMITKEMLIAQRFSDVMHVPGKVQLLARRHRKGFQIHRTVYSELENHFNMTFDLLDSVICTEHCTWRTWQKYRYKDTKDIWDALPNGKLDLLYRAGKATLKSGKDVAAFKTALIPKTCYPDEIEDATVYIAVTLKPASLKSLCLRAINKNRVEYKHKDIPEKHMLPLLWKAHSPETPEMIKHFLQVLSDADRQNMELREKKKQKINEEL